MELLFSCLEMLVPSWKFFFFFNLFFVCVECAHHLV